MSGLILGKPRLFFYPYFSTDFSTALLTAVPPSNDSTCRASRCKPAIHSPSLTRCA